MAGETCRHCWHDGYLKRDRFAHAQGPGTVQRMDLLYASRPIARRLLAGAVERDTAFGGLRVIGVEGLIGFKLQGWINDSRRTQDLEDIRALLRAHGATLDMTEVREYFRLLDREALLDEFLQETD